MRTCETGQTELADGVASTPRPDVSGALIATLAGLAAAWVAAGSLGLLAHPLRRAVTLLLVGTVILAQRPLRGVKPRMGLVLVPLVLGVAAYMVALPLPVANVMSVAVILAFLAFVSTGHKRDILLTSATAVVAFGIYRFAVTSVPWLWLTADLVARGLGHGAGLMTGKAVSVGSTFAGLDFLILTTVFWGLYLPHTKPPRARRALYGFVGILGGHLVYLIVLSYVPSLLAAVPQPPDEGGRLKMALQLIHETIPWNVPVVACAIHMLLVVAMLRWSQWPSAGKPRTDNAAKHETRPVARPGIMAAAALAAVLLPLIAVLHPARPELTGKKIVFYEKGFLNWLKPTHGSYGRLSSGMYGMLPIFVESLGARSLLSADLSEADLEGADALVLIFPDDPWQDGQLDRVHDYVRRGGSLLVLGEHTTHDEAGGNRFNEVLAPTAMQVQFDSATFTVGGWLQSYEALSHPTTAGIADDRNQFGVVIGASVEARWPARPILVGRWGWADLGDEASTRAMMGNDRYDPGERLGDLVLAAEQPLGKGRIVALGDTSGLTNAINVSSYVFTGRLLAYLADGAPAHRAWRQLAALVAGAVLIGLLCRRPATGKTALVAVGLAGSLAVCTAISHARAEVLPEGRGKTPNGLAYIDASHIEAHSSESWRPDGVGGLVLTLMRNGYLVHTLPELTPERLERAGLLISIAPSRSFSQRQVETVKAFVNNGGILILTAGYEDAGPSRPLLDAFGLRVGMAGSDPLEPIPMGHFKSPYIESEGRRVYVRFHAAWPVACDEPNARVLAYGRGDQPVMILRSVGAGKVVLIGDTCFATNKNLEYESGAAFEGLRENADFWRWLLTVLRGQQMWVPPALQGSDTSSTPGDSGGEVAP